MTTMRREINNWAQHLHIKERLTFETTAGGPQHAQVWTCDIKLDGVSVLPAGKVFTGPNKAVAEEAAARALWDIKDTVKANL